jgi:adenosylcobinamide kinase/adenosylcobinamide-phosphate guanylyltransferase
MRICVTGGVRSGKSAVAQRLIADRLVASENNLDLGKALVVVFGRQGCDDEFDSRIARHKADRPDTWDLLELGEVPMAEWECAIRSATSFGASIVLVDCVATLLSSVIDEIARNSGDLSWYARETLDSGLVTTIPLTVKPILDCLATAGSDCVFVTNEVGMAPIPPSALGRLFVDCLGRVNQYVSSQCDKTYLVVSGVTIDMTRISDPLCWE